MADITNREDTLDSRDINDRIEELESERKDLVSSLEEAKEELSSNPGDEADALRSVVTEREGELENWDNDNADELSKLVAFKDELEGYCPDWQHGTQLIRDSYFVEAMQELCSDIGDLPRDIPSYLVIDWDATADNLRVDYTSGEFDGVTYWAR